MSEPDYKQALIQQEHEIQNELGEALYGTSPEGLPQWGDHVAVTLAIVAARRIKQLTEALRQVANVNDDKLGKLSTIEHLKRVAQQALAEYPPPSDDQKDARRYRAIRNHTQMLDPRMDGTSIYRVRGISGRYHNFDEAADMLIEREKEGVKRRRDPFGEDNPHPTSSQ